MISFTDSKRITKSYILVVNALVMIEIPIEQSVNIIANDFKACQKRGRPIDARDNDP